MLEVITSGLLNGLVYAAVAIGLALIWGIMDVINFAHGEFLMIGSYTAYWLYTVYKLDPLFSAPIAAVVLAFVGLATYALIVRRLLKGPPTTLILATFGLGIVLRQVAFYFFTPDYRSLPDTLVSGSVHLGSLNIGRPQLVTGLVALIIVGVLFFLVYRTRWGLGLQAVSEDRQAATFVGVNPDRMNAQVWMLGSAAVGVAGALLTTFFYVFPSLGTVFGLFAFVAVAMGGFGSLPGAVVAGLLIGLVESFAGYYVAPTYKTVFVFGLFLLVLWFRPRGIFGRW